ncbi:MAG: Xaa-Pro peptidase family protein [Gemmatimonadota bacterium]|nr:Xaa-Pro peptidase family protein [Gemmatimonadota bacterium]
MTAEHLEYALFSRGEMERRYSRARAMMAHRDIDALLVSGEENFQYLAGTAASIALHYSLTRPSLFILPLERDPIIVTQGRANLALGSYVADLRDYTNILDFPHQLALQALQDAGLENKRIGAELGQEQRMGIPVGAYSALVEALPAVEFVDCADILIGLRMVKSSEELAYMRQAAAITDRARQRLFDQVEPGMTERQVARLIRQLILEEGGDRTAYVILQLGIPGSGNPFHYDRPLEKGMVLAVDTGACVGMYTTDYPRMATLGPATSEQRRVYQAVLRVDEKMAQALRPGVRCSELYQIGVEAIAETRAELGDLDQLPSARMGHGQGLLVTEPPSICPEDHTVLKEGMVISTEPGVQWGSVQYLWENVHVITADGHEQLTLETNALRELPW